MKQYKFITINQRGKTNDGKPMFVVRNNKSQDELAVIYYYSPWKQYVIQYSPDCMFSTDCNDDIKDFINNEIIDEHYLRPEDIKVENEEE